MRFKGERGRRKKKKREKRKRRTKPGESAGVTGKKTSLPPSASQPGGWPVKGEGGRTVNRTV
jgi:allophanate hydrolase subunit 1